MKVMLLVMGEQRVILDRLYETVQQHCSECVVYRLSKEQQMNLGTFLASHDYQSFDRVVIFSRVKRLAPQLAVLKCIPGLIFLEHDAYQNYLSNSKYRTAYSRLYRRLPWCRVLVSGAIVARRLQAEGIDAVFVSKGYDETMLHNLGRERDIPFGFLGSLKSREYAQRKALLESLAQRTGMLVTRTESGAQYLETLNRIKVFVSADIGMGEFMIKNFEAMACGCVLLAWSQGEEDDLLGFRDMHNVVLYRSEEEAVEKIRLLQEDPQLAARIASQGQAFAESRYSFARVGRDLAAEIQREMKPWPRPTWLNRMWVKARYGLEVSERVSRPADIASARATEPSALPGADQDLSGVLPTELQQCFERAKRVILLANNPAITREDFQALNVGADDVVVSFNLCTHSDLLTPLSVNLFVHGFNAPDHYFFGLPYGPQVQTLLTDPHARCFTVLVGCTVPLCPLPQVTTYWDRMPLPALVNYPVDRPGGKRYGPSTGYSTLVLLDWLRDHSGYQYDLLTLGFSNEAGKFWGGHAWHYERNWLLGADVNVVPLKPRSRWRKLLHR